MCGPAAASLIAQGAGAVSSAAGAMFSASTQKMGLKLDAAVAGINADKARDSARAAMQMGQDAEVQTRLRTGQIKSSERAAMGANNVDMTTGSALNRLVSTDYMGEADAQQIRLNAVREANGYRSQATSYDMKATLDRGAAKGIDPLLIGATSLLTSATQIAGNWYGMKQSGAIGGGGQTGSTLTGASMQPAHVDGIDISNLGTFPGLPQVNLSNGSGSWLDQNMPIGVKTMYGTRF